MLALVDALAFEAMLFAAIGLLIGGLDDLGIDLLFLVRHVKRRRHGRWSVADLPCWTSRGTIAVFVPAWDEAAVIGGMLRAALARFDHADYRIYVGLYPNDPDGIAAVRAVAENDARVRLVIGARDGPTTKADCLNTLWHTVQDDEAAGMRLRAVVFHDAEDVVHPDELRVFDALVDDHAAVQLPVLPLMKAGARFVGGHYGDEFAEAA